MSLRNHSDRPFIAGRPKSVRIIGLRMSPSTRRTRSCLYLASVHAKFKATTLFPSSGRALVINTRFNSRLCLKFRRRTASRRNFSAAMPPGSVIAATLLFGAGFGTSAEQVSMLAVFCVSFSNSVAIADTSESGSPVLSEAERCRASKILLIRFSPRDDAHFDGLFLFRPRTT